MADKHNTVPPGAFQSADPQKIVETAIKIIKSRVCRGQTLRSPTDAKEYFTLILGKFEHEVFTCLFLDAQNRILAAENLFYGTIDAANVYPREVVKSALKHNSAVVIFAHNHPSGISKPSAADQVIIRRLIDALSLVDVRVVDHIIVGSGETLSMAERGLV